MENKKPLDSQLDEGWLLFRKSCPICGCFKQKFIPIDKCNCGYEYDQNEHETGKFKHNYQIAKNALMNNEPMEWYMEETLKMVD